jgi:hypothetical protein
VKVEVSPGVGILAKTVADLRQLTVLPGPIRVEIPRPLYPESVVKVRLPERATPWEAAAALHGPAPGPGGPPRPQQPHGRESSG